jgi:hypothetical protein
MGASRGRLVRQLLVESVMLSFAAGMAGILFAGFFIRVILRLLPTGQFGSVAPTLDVRILGFTVLISLATGLLFGILPAVRSTAGVSDALRAAFRSSEDKGGSRLRGLMVAFQVAMSVFLLIGSGLLIRSLARQVKSDLGFQPEGLLVAEIHIPERDYPELRRLSFFRSLLDAIRSTPGVESAALVNQLPIRNPANRLLQDHAYPGSDGARHSGNRHLAGASRSGHQPIDGR